MNEAARAEGTGALRRFKPYPAYKTSGTVSFSQTPAHWELVRAKLILREIDDRSEAGEEQLLSVSEHKGVVPRTEMVEEGDFLSRAESFEGYRRCRCGDLVMNIMLAWKTGLGFSKSDGIVSPAYSVFRLSRKDSEPRFFDYLLRSHEYVSEFRRWSYGIVDSRLRLYPEVFLRLPILVPPCPEQRAIAAFLDRETARIDTLVAKKERLIELLLEKRTALVTRTVTKGLDPNVSMKDAGIEWLGEIPAHWEVKRLWHLTPSGRGIMYGIVLPGPNVDDGVPIVKGGDVSAKRLRLDRLNRTTREIESGYARSRLRGGDLVYAIRGSIGEVAMVPDELAGANLTQDAARVAYTAATHGPWLLNALKSAAAFAQLEAGAVGATIRGINIMDLKRAMIVVPSPVEQRAIAAFLDAETSRLDALVAKIREAIGRLKELRTALISAAVTGKIDVREEAA